jgi:hypothetical protein
MMKIVEKEFNVITGETTITERDETAAEKKSREARAKEVATEQAAVEAKATQRAAILDRIGLTADEARLLLGGN